MSVPPPTVPEDRLGGWVLSESSVDRPFDAGLVRATAHTAVYEDAALHEHLAERTGRDRIRRFFFASRLLLEPRPPASRTLWRLVADRSMAGFEDELRERGFLAVERTEERRFDVRGTEARLARYDARSRAGEAVVSVRGWLAVWPTDARGEFLLAGGAYPTSVVESPRDEEDTRSSDENAPSGDGDGPSADSAASLTGAFDPNRFREELFALIRATQ
ncbi:hypothetical protein [Haloprofundus salilacus]|uniref:hypothetical protein n=1 Tax=Haloprofundus salilacus TaxID=2876190 RepID=UPI001CCE4536|nr:hypothetical protein [Haloprofundus salilacus]